MNRVAFALDLSSPKGSFGLFSLEKSGALIAHHSLPGTFTHSEKLLEHLEKVLEKTGVRFESIEEWVTTRGPGSFTGLRIAFSTLKAFATVSKKPFITVESPEARAYAYLNQIEAGLLPKDLGVLSHLTAERYVLTHYEQKEGTLLKGQESLATLAEAQAFIEGPVLVDSRLPEKFILNRKKSLVFDLSSEHLCYAHQLKSNRVFQWSELHSVVPSYFGSSHFD